MRAGNASARAFYHGLGFTPKGILARQVKMDRQYEDQVFIEVFL